MTPMMDIIMWKNLFGLIIEAIFPVLVVFLFFTIAEKRCFKDIPVLRLVLIAFGFGISYRIFVFFSGVPFPKRYFYPLACTGVILAAPGFIALIKILHNKVVLKFSKWKISYTQLAFFCILTVCLVCAGKGLNPDFDKAWINEIADEIKKHAPQGTKTVLITNSTDHRIAYYSKSMYLYYALPPNPVFYITRNGKLINNKKKSINGAIVTTGTGPLFSQSIAIDMPYGIENLAENVEELGGERVFFLMEESDASFRKRFERTHNVFPLKFIKEYREKKAPVMSLYQGMPLPENKKELLYRKLIFQTRNSE